jgi:hypothetical protein
MCNPFEGVLHDEVSLAAALVAASIQELLKEMKSVGL